MSSFDVSHADPDLPDIDDRLAIPGERHEVIDGELVYVAPADPPHAEVHARVPALVAAHAAPAFQVAVDMLTRTSAINDIAPDVSIFPRAKHAVTGGRQLEHLAFEVVSTQTLRHAGKKAALLINRGVRRVFAIDIERSRVLEWSVQLNSWRVLARDGVIDDLVFTVPLPIDRLLSEAIVDDAVAEALIAKQNRLITAMQTQARAEGRIEGLARGRAVSIIALLDHRDIGLTEDVRVRILAEQDMLRLHRWLAIAVVCTDAAELFS